MSKERFSCQPRRAGLRKKFGVGAREGTASVAPDDALAPAASSTSDTTADGKTESHDNGVPVDISVPRSRRADRRTRQRRAASRASIDRGPWLSADKVSEYLALPSPGAVRELERRGVLPGHRLGGSLRLSRPEIDALLLESRQPTVTEISEGTGITAPPAEGLGPLMNPEQTIVYLGLPSTAALDHRVRRGEVPCYRIGKKFLFRAAELDAAMKDERRRKARRLSAAERQLTFDDLPRTVGHGRPPVDEKGGH